MQKALASLRADPDVEYAELDHIVSVNSTPNDPYFSRYGSWGQAYDDLWGIKKIGAPAAWDTTSGSGMVVAVVDSGLDYNHPDISANVWTNSNEIAGNSIDDDGNGYIDDVHGWNFVGNTNDPLDDHGHGTHVSGTIAASGNNGIGVIGVAWQAKIMPVKALDRAGTGWDSDLANAIIYAANNGADVINNSWVGWGGSQTVSDAVNYAYNLGAVVIASAGNSGADAMGFYPAKLPNVITVAATDRYNNLAGFSNYGSKIDVSAPGVDVLSLQAAGSSLGLAVSPGYMRLSGTSMAAPHVSGLAALVLAQHTSYSNEDVRQVLRVSTTDLGSSGYDLTYGYGQINAVAALGVLGPLEAKITSPVNGVVTRGVLTIFGVARGTGFSHYVLEYGSGALPNTWTTIQTSGTPADGALGLFDTTSLADGVYDVRLTAFNSSNRAFVDRIQVVVHSVIVLVPAPPPDPIASMTFKNGAVISITGTAVCGSFTNFQVEWATGTGPNSGWQSAGITLTGGGASPVSSSLLASWDTSSIIAAGYYTIRLTCNSSQLPPQQARTMVYLEPDLLSYNWPQFLFQGPGLGAGVVPARNTDGTFRLLLEAPKGPFAGVSVLWTLGLDGTLQQTQQPGAGGYMQPSVANFEGGTAEQAMVIDFSDLDFFREDASLSILNTNPNVWYVGSQTVVEDLSDDNTWETVGYGLDYNNHLAYVSAWRPDGTQLNSNFPIQLTFNNPDDGNLNRNPVLIGDLNGDGKKEIVAMEDLSSSTFTLRLFASDGSPLTWKAPVLPGILSTMAAADLDNNGKLETIVAANTDTQNFLHVFQPDGTERPGWPLIFVNSGTSAQNYLAIGDLNRDGSKDIVYAHAGFLYVFKRDGTSFSSIWPLNAGTGAGSAFGYNALVIGEVDGDGFPEIVTVLNTLASGEKLLAIRRNGAISKSWQLTGNGCYTQFYPAPTIGDFNQDGITDVAVAFSVSGGSSCPSQTAAGVVTILSTGAPYNPALNDWPLVRHDARNTSVWQSPVPISPTTTAILSSPNPSTAGQSVTFTAAVAATVIGASVPTGLVNFVDSATDLGSCTLVSGTCTFATSTLAVGTHTVTAQYLGDGHSAVSTSAALSQVVNPAPISPTTTALLSSLNPSTAGQSVTFTARVAATATGANVPAGQVNFVDSATDLGSCTLVSGTCALATSTLAVGTHTITAQYLGDGHSAVSTSGTLSQVVNPAPISPTTTAIFSSPNPSTAGQSVTFTAAVAATVIGASVPTGLVNFVDSATGLGSCTLVSGTCTFATSTLAVGTHTVTAQYLGDGHSAVSTSAALSQIIDAADFSLDASSAQTVNAGSSATYTITVTPGPSPYSFAVSNFMCGPLPAGVGCTFSANSVTPGATSASTALTVTTTSRTLAMVPPRDTALRALFATCLGFTWIGVLGIIATPLHLKRTKSGLFTATLALIAVCGVGCGGGTGGGIQPAPTNPAGTPAGTYNIVVTATGNAGVSHSATVRLTVN